MSRLYPCLIVLSFFALCAGCRRQDIREFSIEIPSLTAGNQSAVAAVVEGMEGVEKGSLVWDLAARKLTLRYDSMVIARENVRQAIAAKGFQVVFPPPRGGYAGYVDEKAK